MLKTFLVLCGTLLASVAGLQAQHAHAGGGAAHSAAFGARSSAFAARPSAYRGFNHNGGSFNRYGHHHHGNYGRYYYLGGIPYFYPFGFGFGYPSYYGSYYGGFGDAYGYGGGYPDRDAAYNGRIADNNSGQQAGGSLPEAVQRQLAKRGYYKGTVDGQFGPASRTALSRFQKKAGLKETGKIDEDTLDALGFTDRH